MRVSRNLLTSATHCLTKRELPETTLGDACAGVYVSNVGAGDACGLEVIDDDVTFVDPASELCPDGYVCIGSEPDFTCTAKWTHTWKSATLAMVLMIAEANAFCDSDTFMCGALLESGASCSLDSFVKWGMLSRFRRKRNLFENVTAQDYENAGKILPICD